MTSIQLYAANSGLTVLGDLDAPRFYSEAYGVSADGNVLVGYALSANGNEAFRWTESGGMGGLGDLNGGIFRSVAYGVSADGNVVVGFGTSTSGQEAFRWTESDGMEGLGDLDGGRYNSAASGVSADGNVVVGFGVSTSGKEAFRWVESRSHWAREGVSWDRLVDSGRGWLRVGAMEGLGDLDGGDFESAASGVSADGNVVVGYGSSANGYEAFRWTESGGMEGLGDLDGGDFGSVANGVSADGNVVVGYGTSTSGQEAFRWTESGGMEGLGRLKGYSGSAANGVSADGNVVVGTGSKAAINGLKAFRWTESGGMQSVKRWLRNNGVTIAINPAEASSVSDDGSVVAGFTVGKREAYLARVSDIGSGVMMVDDARTSLTSTTESVGTAVCAASLLVNGAYSRPMSRRIAVGQKTVWLAGDWGHDNHNSREGPVGLAEVGGGHNFGSSQINVSLGKTWAGQNLIHDGGINADGKYVMVEGILPVAEEKGLYATIGTYYHGGNADIRRGYLNAGLTDNSSANPDTRTWGLRARIDWENAFLVASTQFSPYADLSYTDTHMDGYTETGGGFPARFDSRNSEVTELHAGLNAAMPISNPSSAAQVVGNIEVAHRFNDEGARISGQMLGLFAFDLAQQNYDSTWLKAGVGVEGQLGQGKALLMLNGTTEGKMPSAWLAALYQMTF